MQASALRPNRSTTRISLAVYPSPFPVQLNQFLIAIQHVMSLGVHPSKICLAGDSAGADILMQLIGHVLHPSSVIAQSPTTNTLTGFAGITFISPWTLPNNVREYDDSFDLVPSKCLELWTDTYLSTVPESHLGYVQSDNISPGWFSGLDKVTNRILITTGRNEVLYPAIVRFSETLEKSHNSVQLNVQEGGVHCDAMFDIGAKSTAPHPVEKQVTEWFAETITSRIAN